MKKYPHWPAVAFGILILIGIAISEGAEANETILKACSDVGLDACPTVALSSFDKQTLKGSTTCKTHDGQRMCMVELDRALIGNPKVLREAALHELCHVKVYYDTGKSGGHKRRWQKCGRRAGMKTYYAFN